MSRQKEPRAGRGEGAVEELYKLKTKAVDDLVTADVSNTPKYSEEELRKYRSRSGIHAPEWLKILLIKFWFPAAVCFFFFWGLGPYVGNLLDLLVITAIALGIVTDVLTNNALRFFAQRPGANDRWMMYPKRSYVSFLLNILHSGVVLFLVYTIYNAINVAIITLSGMSPDAVPVGVEPIMFGLFYVLCDSFLIFCKNTLLQIIREAKRTAGNR